MDPAIAAIAAKAEADAKHFTDSRLQELTKKQAALSTEKQKMALERSEIAKEKAELAAYKAMKADKLRNPGKYLEQDYGPDWKNVIAEFQLKGVTPDLVASRIDETKADFEKRLADQKAEFEKRLADRDAADTKQGRQYERDQAVEWMKANADKLPWISEFEDHGTVLRYIDEHEKATSTKDDDGNDIPGERLTVEAAALEVEKRIDALMERGAAAKAKRAGAAKSVPVDPKRPEQTKRQALSTDTTDEAEAPPMNDQERFKRASAAMDRAMADKAARQSAH